MTYEFSGWVRLEIFPVNFIHTILVRPRDSDLRTEAASSEDIADGATRQLSKNVKEHICMCRTRGVLQVLHALKHTKNRGRK
jgi:hypothetical protein